MQVSILILNIFGVVLTMFEWLEATQTFPPSWLVCVGLRQGSSVKIWVHSCLKALPASEQEGQTSTDQEQLFRLFLAQFRSVDSAYLSTGSFYYFFNHHLPFLKFLFFLERGEGREKERERNIWCVRDTSIDCLLQDPKWGPTHNPGVCPDWESNCDLWA